MEITEKSKDAASGEVSSVIFLCLLGMADILLNFYRHRSCIEARSPEPGIEAWTSIQVNIVPLYPTSVFTLSETQTLSLFSFGLTLILVTLPYMHAHSLRD